MNLSQVVKLVVASAVNGDGDQLYPRKWNHDFIGMPIVKEEEQKRPTVTASDIEQILADSKRRYAVLFALLAGTAIRIGEAVAVKVTDFSPDYCVLKIQRSILRNKEQKPKTSNSVCEVDIAAPLARLLQEHAAGKTGYLFATSTGTALQQRNALGALHDAKKSDSTPSADSE